MQIILSLTIYHHIKHQISQCDSQVTIGAMKNSVEIPVYISGLSDREAIRDTMSRCLQGLDTNNEELFVSAFHDNDDVVFEVDGQKIQGISNIVEQGFDNIGPLDTTHVLSNERVYVNGDGARLSATAISNHFRPGEGVDPNATEYMVGCTYEVAFSKATDNLWKIKLWSICIKWKSGDPSIIGQ